MPEAEKEKKNRVACAGCRKIKVRCLPVNDASSDYEVCKRCLRLNLACQYETNKRGRKTDVPCPAIIIKATNLSSLDTSNNNSSSSKPKRPRLSSSNSSDQPPQQARSLTDAAPSRRQSDGSSSEEDPLLGRIWDTQERDHMPNIEVEGPRPPPPPPLPSPLPINQGQPFYFPSPSYTGNNNNNNGAYPLLPPTPSLPSPSAWSLSFPPPPLVSPLPTYPNHNINNSNSNPLPPSSNSHANLPFATSLMSFPHPALVAQQQQQQQLSRPSPTQNNSYQSSSSRINDPTAFFRPESYLRGPSSSGSAERSTQSPSTSTSAPLRGRSGEGKGGALSVVDMLSNVPILQEPAMAAAATPRDEEGDELGVRNGAEEEFLRGMDDPVGRGLLLQEDVEPLFTTFFTLLNPASCQLDSRVHTPDFVQQTSPVLFTAVLCVAAKVERPDLYPPLLIHANSLVAKGFAEDLVTVEFVSSISILSFWKPSHDSSSWRRLGYAIRLAIELDLHLPQKRPLPVDRLEAMKVVSRERVWCQLIAFDRTLFFQQGRPRMIDVAFEPDMEEWGRNHDSVFIPEDSVLICTSVLLKLHMVSLSCRRAADFETKKMLLDHQISLFNKWKSDWMTDTPKHELSRLGAQSIKNYCVLFEFEIAALRLSIVGRTPAPNSRTLAPDPGGNGGAGPANFFVENMNEETILAFDYAIRASIEALRYFVEELAETLAFAQDTVMIGAASVSVFLARNISRAPRRAEITELLKGAAHVCRSAAKQPVDAAAYQTRFFLSLLQAISTNSGGSGGFSAPPSRVSSPRLKKKGPLAPVDLSALDTQLNGISDLSVSQWTFPPANPSTSFDDMFADPSNWFPGFEASGEVSSLSTNWGFGDIGTGGEWGGGGAGAGMGMAGGGGSFAATPIFE